MNGEGYLTLVETKLWRNPEARRTVVAQIIDYASHLSTWTYDDLRQAVFWNARDLERKLADFQTYYNEVRSHASLKGHTPLTFADGHTVARAELNNVRWVSHCRDLVQLPVAT